MSYRAEMEHHLHILDESCKGPLHLDGTSNDMSRGETAHHWHVPGPRHILKRSVPPDKEMERIKLDF